MLGGFGNAQDADDTVKALAKEMKGKAETALGETDGEFEAVKFTKQVVNRANYLIKVKVGDGKYVHLKVHVPLPTRNAPNELLEQEKGKTLEDPLK